MADRLKRQKDILKNRSSQYLEATTKEYTKYLEGSPTYVIYYQLDQNASTQDQSLENVNSLLGDSSPRKYRKISDLPIYGVDALDVLSELGERGFQSTVNGEFIVTPGTIEPHADDFFVFDGYDMDEHLFIIKDVQYDKISPKKYYKVQFSLYPYNIDAILNNISDEYVCETNDDLTGSSSSTIVKASEAANHEKIKDLVDGLIERYEKLFYNDDADTFTYKDIKNNTTYWCPYLQHFLHETKALTKYSDTFMNEIYINDVTEYENPEIFNDEVYRGSIFRNVEIQNPNLDFDSNFLSVSSYNLKMWRNLPFFMSTENYKLIFPISNLDPKRAAAYLNAYPLLFMDSTNAFVNVDHYHKVHQMDDLHLQRAADYIKAGDIVYECHENELIPSKVCIAIERTDSTGKYIEIEDASISNFTNLPQNVNDNFQLFAIINAYLNDKLVVDDILADAINNYYYKKDMANYILMPLIIYILKKSIEKS